jgi:hypothetical protein
MRQRRGEVGQVGQGQQPPSDPEDVGVREERDQAEDRNDLELELLRHVCHSLRRGMRTQVDIADAQHRENQEDSRRGHQDIHLAGLHDIEREMMRR